MTKQKRSKSFYFMVWLIGEIIGLVVISLLMNPPVKLQPQSQHTLPVNTTETQQLG